MDANNGSLDVTLFERLFLAAFKDLSSLRHPAAAKVLAKIKSLNSCFKANDFQLLWAQKVIKKPGGGATIVLHVSDLKSFRGRLLEGVQSDQFNGDLENGLLIQNFRF